MSIGPLDQVGIKLPCILVYWSIKNYVEHTVVIKSSSALVLFNFIPQNIGLNAGIC